jgi:hypothetical protein
MAIRHLTWQRAESQTETPAEFKPITAGGLPYQHVNPGDSAKKFR